MDTIFCLGWNYWIDKSLTVLDSNTSGELFPSNNGIIEQIVLNNYKQVISFRGHCKEVYFEKHVFFISRWYNQRTWHQYKLELIKFLGANAKNVLKFIN